MCYNIKEKRWGGVSHVDCLTQLSSKMFTDGCPAAWGLGKHRKNPDNIAMHICVE